MRKSLDGRNGRRTYGSRKGTTWYCNENLVPAEHLFPGLFVRLTTVGGRGQQHDAVVCASYAFVQNSLNSIWATGKDGVTRQYFFKKAYL